MKRNNLFNLVLASIWCAIIILGIVFLKIPLSYGFGHLGDGLILITTLFLPMGYSISCASLGAFLSDIISGYGIYAPFSLIIKALGLLWFLPFRKMEGRIVRFIIPSILFALTNIGLYFITDRLLYGFEAGVSAMLGNIMQGIISIVMFIPIAYIFELKIKR